MLASSKLIQFLLGGILAGASVAMAADARRGSVTNTGSGAGSRSGMSVGGRASGFNPANAFALPSIPSGGVTNAPNAYFGSPNGRPGTTPSRNSGGQVSGQQGGSRGSGGNNGLGGGSGTWQQPGGSGGFGGNNSGQWNHSNSHGQGNGNGHHGGDSHSPFTWHDVDWRHIDNNDYRRRMYYHSFYRYYPYPTVNVFDYAYAAPAFVDSAPSTVDYSVVDHPVTQMSTSDMNANGAATQAAVDDARGPWVPGHFAEVPVEDLIGDQTVEVYHPAVYRQKPDGTLEKMEDASFSKEPKVRIVLTRRWIEGHYANQPPPMPTDSEPALPEQTDPPMPAAAKKKPSADK